MSEFRPRVIAGLDPAIKLSRHLPWLAASEPGHDGES